MGEYLKGGRKVGTCENLYYCTADQARGTCHRQLGFGWENQAGWRFRFPFPDEDGTPIGNHDPFERSLAVPGSGAVPDGVKHGSVQFQARGKDGRQFGCFLASLPCPCGTGATYAHSDRPTDDSQPAGIVDTATGARKSVHVSPVKIHRNGISGLYGIAQQKRMESGQLWLVCQCHGCGAKWRCDLDEATKIAAAFEAKANAEDSISGRKYYAEIARRIMAGYED